MSIDERKRQRTFLRAVKKLEIYFSAFGDEIFPIHEGSQRGLKIV